MVAIAGACVLFLAELTQICQAYQQKIEELEGSKWDLEQEVEVKDAQVCDQLSLHGVQL